MKVTCVSSQLRASPKAEDHVIQYAFVQAAPVDGKAGEVCFDGAFRLHVRADEPAPYQVGRVYDLKIEVQKNA